MIDWSTISHFSESEFRCPCGACTGSTHPPMRESLVRILNEIRTDFGHPIAVTSGYRCQAHNTAVGGASDSAHLTGQAVDFRWRGPRMANLLIATLQWVSRLEIATAHLHIEYRPERRPAVWIGRNR